MQKIRLDVNNLLVESFETTGVDGNRRGTVRALESYDCPTPAGTCISVAVLDTCNTMDDPSCADPTCQVSCNPQNFCCATDGLTSCF